MAIQSGGVVAETSFPRTSFHGDNAFRSEETSQRSHNPLRWRELDAVRAALSNKVGTRPYCHARRGESLAVHPDGMVYPCAQTTGDLAAVAGTVSQVDWVRLRWFHENMIMQGDCGDCQLFGRCPGDCPSRLRYHASHQDNIMCVVYRTIAGKLMSGRSGADLSSEQGEL